MAASRSPFCSNRWRIVPIRRRWTQSGLRRMRVFCITLPVSSWQDSSCIATRRHEKGHYTEASRERQRPEEASPAWRFLRSLTLPARRRPRSPGRFFANSSLFVFLNHSHLIYSLVIVTVSSPYTASPLEEWFDEAEGFYVDRAAGRHCDHRRLNRPAAPRHPEGS